MNNKLREPDSFLGENPKCEICKKNIEIGEEVVQLIVGIATLTEPDYELGIESEMGMIEKRSRLAHVACDSKIGVN